MRLALVVVAAGGRGRDARVPAAASDSDVLQTVDGRRKDEGDNIRDHVDVLSRLGDLVAICEVGTTQAADAARGDVRRHTDLDRMIRSEKFDGAVLVPYADMSRAASRLLGAKKHVFVAEWPVALDTARGAALLQLAKRRGVTLGCGRMLGPNRALSGLRQVISDGRYGRLVALGLSRRGAKTLAPCGRGYGYGDEDSGGIRGDPADDRRADAAEPGFDEAQRRRADEYAVRGAHACDICIVNHLLDSVPYVVFARACGMEQHGSRDDSSNGADGGVRDDVNTAATTRSSGSGSGANGAPPEYVSMMLGYGGGRIATISSNTITLGEELRVDATFERAVVAADLLSGHVGKMPNGDHGGDGSNSSISDDTDLPDDDLSGILQAGAARAKEAGHADCGDIDRSDSRPARDALFRSVSEFIESVQKKTSYDMSPARDALSSVRVAKAALLSSKRGIPIYLDLRLQ